jgi:hypothetical protein
MEDLEAALKASASSGEINTAFVERQNGTDRTFNARKRRKTYEFSKDLVVHIAVAWWVTLCYNFHHLHRSLRVPLGGGKYLHRTPAMTAGIVDLPLSPAEILSLQIVGFTPSPARCAALRRLRHAHGPAP